MRITLKLATSLDGRIATATGESQWITGEAARLEGHRLRAAHDAILVGIGTILADDPQLTARLPGRAVDQPLRVIMDSNVRTPPTAMVASGEPSLILATRDGETVGAARVERIDSHDGRPTPQAAAAAVARAGASSILIEGGGEVAASFVRADLVDRIEWFRAPILLGAEGRACVATLALANLASAPKFRRLCVEPLGDDLWERYERL